MRSVPRHRWRRKIRRTGQHTAPSQAAKVAQKAGKAAPALAVAGALTLAPQVHKPAPPGPAPAGAPIYRPRHAAAPAATPAPAPHGGTLSYAALEQLRVAEGGNPAGEAFAACIAEHESGGNPGAISPTTDYGLWQEHDDPAARSPVVSAQTAVQMSSDGPDWSA